MSTTISFDCPDMVLLSLKEDSHAFARDLRLSGAMKLYELGRLSSGRAAELAGLSRTAFLERTADFRVSALELTSTELQEDVRNA